MIEMATIREGGAGQHMFSPTREFLQFYRAILICFLSKLWLFAFKSVENN